VPVVAWCAATAGCSRLWWRVKTISASGLGCWEASEPDGQFEYLEFEVDEITYRPGVAQELPATSASEEAAK
jgi:hypothetical protein